MSKAFMPKSTSAAREVFDINAIDYDERSRLVIHNYSSLIFQRRKDVVIKLLDDLKIKGKFLDFGMGPGVFVEDVTKRGNPFHGIDISPEMVRLAERMNNPLATFEIGGLNTLNHYNEEFDAVLAIGLLDYLEHIASAIEQFANTLLPGGYLIISFRNKRSLPTIGRDITRKILKSWFLNLKWRSNSVFMSSIKERSYSAPSDLIPMLLHQGFQVLNLVYFDCSPLFFNFPLPLPIWESWLKFDPCVARNWTRCLCSSGVLAARKMESYR